MNGRRHVHVLRGDDRLITTPIHRDRGAVVPHDLWPHRPDFIVELPGAGGVRRNPGTLGNAGDFVEDPRNPALDGRRIVRRLEEALAELRGRNLKRLLEARLEVGQKLANLGSQRPAVGEAAFTRRPERSSTSTCRCCRAPWLATWAARTRTSALTIVDAECKSDTEATRRMPRGLAAPQGMPPGSTGDPDTTTRDARDGCLPMRLTGSEKVQLQTVRLEVIPRERRAAQARRASEAP